MTKGRARVECCRFGCSAAYEYWADLSVKLGTEYSSYGNEHGEPTAEIQMSSPGEGWRSEGHSIRGVDEYVCPVCAASEKTKQ
jgi:hypothetical protein